MNCYLLVGGRSQRMGCSKSDLFLDRVAGVARAAFTRVIAVQRSGGDAALGVETIYETVEHRLQPVSFGSSPAEAGAPSFGVLCALEHAQSRCFVLAVDYPLVTPELLTHIAKSSRAAIVAPRWNDRLQMLCAAYDAPRVAPRLAARIAAGTLDLRGLADEIDIEVIDEAALRARFGGEPLMNVNTPEELEAARIR